MLVALVAIHSSEIAHRQTLVFPHEHQRFFIPPFVLAWAAIALLFAVDSLPIHRSFCCALFF